MILFAFFRFEDMDNSNSKKEIVVDAEYSSGYHELLLRTDLLNLRVYICAPEVLLLFSDNFDYQVWYCVVVQTVQYSCRLLQCLACLPPCGCFIRTVGNVVTKNNFMRAHAEH